jgi:hypothetical protein
MRVSPRSLVADNPSPEAKKPEIDLQKEKNDLKNTVESEKHEETKTKKNLLRKSYRILLKK